MEQPLLLSFRALEGAGVPAGAQGMSGCGSQCPGLGDKVGISYKLGSVTLEGFSSLSGSLILVYRDGVLPIHGCFYPLKIFYCSSNCLPSFIQ